MPTALPAGPLPAPLAVSSERARGHRLEHRARPAARCRTRRRCPGRGVKRHVDATRRGVHVLREARAATPPCRMKLPSCTVVTRTSAGLKVTVTVSVETRGALLSENRHGVRPAAHAELGARRRHASSCADASVRRPLAGGAGAAGCAPGGGRRAPDSTRLRRRCGADVGRGWRRRRGGGGRLLGDSRTAP